MLHAQSGISAKAPSSAPATRATGDSKPGGTGFSSFVDESLAGSRPETRAAQRDKAEAPQKAAPARSEPGKKPPRQADGADRPQPAQADAPKNKPEAAADSAGVKQPGEAAAEAAVPDSAILPDPASVEAAATPQVVAPPAPTPVAVPVAAPAPAPQVVTAENEQAAAGSAPVGAAAAAPAAPQPIEGAGPGETEVRAQMAPATRPAKPELSQTEDATPEMKSGAPAEQPRPIGSPLPQPRAATGETKAEPPAPGSDDALAADAAPPSDAPKAAPREHAPAAIHATLPEMSAPSAPGQQTTPTTQFGATNASPAPVAMHVAGVTVAQLPVELAARVQSGATRFEIRLEPAELGRIDVRIEIDRQGQVSSHITVEKPETLALLKQDAPQLQRALVDAGLKTADSGLQFSLGDQSQPRQQQLADQQQPQRFLLRDDDTVVAAPPVRSYGRLIGPSSGVDIRV